MINAQQKIPGISTDSQPAATTVGDKYFVAWTKSDGTIWWTTLSVNRSNDGYVTNELRNTGFSSTDGYGPALTNLAETVWMAWLENQVQAPFEPGFPENQRREPPVIMVSSFDGSTWSSAEPVWNPGLTGSDLWQPGFQGPAAISSPAIAATDSELFLTWCEYATKGSDALALFSEGTSASPPPQTQIFFSKWRSGKGWTPRQAVAGALTGGAPALLAHNGVVSLAWRGATENGIWFAQYTDDHGWGAPAKLSDFETSVGPALGAGDSGITHLVWKGASDSRLFAASSGADARWSSQRIIPVVATSAQPALASQLSASTDILLAWKGASSSDILVGPLDALESKQVMRYRFALADAKILEPRSPDRELDTLLVTLSVAVGSRPVVKKTLFLGDHKKGDLVGIQLNLIADVADDERVVMSYVMLNRGGASSSSDVMKKLEAAGETIAKAAVVASSTVAAIAAGTAINMVLPGIGTLLVPVFDSALIALGGWLVGEVADLISLIAPNCDGPVAAGVPPLNRRTTSCQR